MIKQIDITVSGAVQGVFFRKYTQQKALELGVTGFVENTANGDVHVVAQSDEHTLKQLIDWCWTGSPISKVQNVAYEEVTPSHPFEGFIIKR